MEATFSEVFNMLHLFKDATVANCDPQKCFDSPSILFSHSCCVVGFSLRNSYTESLGFLGTIWKKFFWLHWFTWRI